MPELPEVETVRLGLVPAMVGKAIDAVHLGGNDLRRPFPKTFARALSGKTVVALRRRAKFLVAELDDGNSLVMHLGMSGSFRIESGTASETPGHFHHPRGEGTRHDHVIFEMRGGPRVVYNDPRRFGSMDIVPTAELESRKPLRDLGIEPLGPDFTPGRLAEALAGSATSIKAALLDQQRVAGLGNIYVCEALWYARISPLRKAGDLVLASGKPGRAAVRLTEAIVDVLQRAVEAGGSTLRNHAKTDGTLGLFQHQFAVYGREGEPCPAPGCAGSIVRIVQAGRSTFYCPTCQR